MSGKILKHGWVNRKKIVIFSIILIFLVVGLILFLPVSSNKIVYVNTTGLGDYNCDGSNDQVEINRALAYVAENPQFTTVYERSRCICHLG